MSAEGAVMFARYAYPPNELGYCGPSGAGALLRPEATAEIARRARQFEGAWSYLDFIASASGIDDPLDVRVVEAYWIGNALLDPLDPAALVAWLRARFAGQVGGTWRAASARAVPHHAFQVFEVYPWAGLLAATGNPTALDVLEQCRIRVGTVLSVAGETAVVRSRPLSWTAGALSRGDERDETVRWSIDGMSLLDGVAVGDRVALHWDWLCDVLTDEQVERVEEAERRQLGALAR